MNKTFIQDESGHLVEKRDPSLIEPLSPTMGENIYLQIQDNIVINCAVPPERTLACQASRVVKRTHARLLSSTTKLWGAFQST